MTSLIDTNPKSTQGAKKVPLQLVPPSFTAMTAVGLADGLKYGRNNYREQPMSASTLVGAIKRHLDLWFEGQTYSSDRRVPHLANAAASLAILIEMQTHGTLIDDRNPNGHEALEALYRDLEEVVADLDRQQGDKVPASRHFTMATLKDEDKVVSNGPLGQLLVPAINPAPVRNFATAGSEDAKQAMTKPRPR
jgi:hypothetical protein